MAHVCKWHEIWVKNCLTCNPTPSNVYYIPKEDNEEEIDFEDNSEE